LWVWELWYSENCSAKNVTTIPVCVISISEDGSKFESQSGFSSPDPKAQVSNSDHVPS